MKGNNIGFIIARSDNILTNDGIESEVTVLSS